MKKQKKGVIVEKEKEGNRGGKKEKQSRFQIVNEAEKRISLSLSLYFDHSFSFLFLLIIIIFELPTPILTTSSSSLIPLINQSLYPLSRLLPLQVSQPRLSFIFLLFVYQLLFLLHKPSDYCVCFFFLPLQRQNLSLSLCLYLVPFLSLSTLVTPFCFLISSLTLFCFFFLNITFQKLVHQPWSPMGIIGKKERENLLGE